MKIAAAHAIAAVIPEEELTPEYVIPSSFDKRVALAVANAVAKAAVEEGINVCHMRRSNKGIRKIYRAI